MRNEQLYLKTVDILLDAYNEGHLQTLNCYACAVGNIVAASIGKKILKDSRGECYWEDSPTLNSLRIKSSIKDMWINLRGREYGTIDKIEVKNNTLAVEQVHSTGYTVDEIVRVEHAFEVPRINSQNGTMLGRLSSVIIELGKIHETKQEEDNLSISKFQNTKQHEELVKHN
jgi:hypothetical protein